MLHEKYPALDRWRNWYPLSLEIARFKILAARRKIIRRGENTQVSVDDLPLAGRDRSVSSRPRATSNSTAGSRSEAWATGAARYSA